jgi:hypothetical protein
LNVLQEALLFTDKKFDDTLPCLREIIGLCLINNLRCFNLDFIAFEANNLNILLAVYSHLNQLTRPVVLLLHEGFELFEELRVDGFP